MPGNAGVKIESEVLQRALKNISLGMEDATIPLAGTGRIMITGIEDQFDSYGQHYGTPWAPASKKNENLRHWEGKQKYNMDKPLTVSGATRNSFKGFAGKKTLVVGSTMAHTKELHEGSGPFIATYRQGSRRVDIPYSGKPPREIVPESHGFTKREEDLMTKEFIDHFVDIIRAVNRGL